MMLIEFDDRVSRFTVDEHHRSCESCRLRWETAHTGTDLARRRRLLEEWRLEFWRCRVRAFWRLPGHWTNRGLQPPRSAC